MERIAADSGYTMRYLGEGEEPPRRIWNTLLAHKLLSWVLAQHGAVYIGPAMGSRGAG